MKDDQQKVETEAKKDIEDAPVLARLIGETSTAHRMC